VEKSLHEYRKSNKRYNTCLPELQIIEVTIITYLNGEQINGILVREFIVAVGRVAALGIAFRFVAQQGANY